jgi:hypothetical protein
MSKKINKKNLEKLKIYFAKIDSKANHIKVRGTGVKPSAS